MKFPQNILVIISGRHRNNIALKRAVHFAKFYDIKLNLFSCVYDPGTELSPILPNVQRKALKKSMLQSQLEYLDELKHSIEGNGIPVTISVKWNRKIQRAVIETCNEIKPDLVIKRISESASSINPFIMPVDWQLLRQCPAPLLLVKDEKWQLTAPVLAAVDAASADQKEQRFNRKIIAYAKMLDRLTESSTHVVTTHISPQIDSAFNIPGFNPKELCKKVTRLNKDKLQELVEDQNIKPECLHIIEGLAEDKITALSKKIDAQLVVMGTIGREGIKGALMGNTAERVLTQLQCEVLALRP